MKNAAAALLALGACIGSYFSITSHVPPKPVPPSVNFPDLIPRPPVRFAEQGKAAGLDYQWKIDGPRPLDILQTIGNGCAFLDYNNDGNLDILLVGPKLALYRGDGQGHFADETHQTGLDTFSGHFLGCAVGDYDNDGYDDVYISGYRTGLLLRNEGGNFFRNITAQAGLMPQPWGTCCAFGSFGDVPYLDLYICNYVGFGPGDMGKVHDPNYYRPLKGAFYHNVNGRRFMDVTKSWGMDKTDGRGLGAAFAPINASGAVGLAVANDMGSSDLFVRFETSRAQNIGARSGAASSPRTRLTPITGRMGIDWGDYDNDGLFDLFVTTFQGEPKILLRSQGGSVFRDMGGSLPGTVYSNLAFGAKWLDADNSGWLGLLISNGHVNDDIARRELQGLYRQPTLFLYNRHGQKFVDATKSAEVDRLPLIVGRGLAIGDYDNDGRVDALVVDSEGKPLLLHNESAPVGHWLSLTLQGTRCNRDGYGTMITAVAGGLTQTRLCHADGSYLSSSDKRVHLGLGAATIIQTLTIRWPDGQTDIFHNVSADRQVQITEAEQTLKALN